MKKKFSRAGATLLKAILILLVGGLIGCSISSCSIFTKPEPVIVMPESKTIKLNQGDAAPYSGWLLTDSAMAKFLEQAEKCKEEKSK